MHATNSLAVTSRTYTYAAVRAHGRSGRSRTIIYRRPAI